MSDVYIFCMGCFVSLIIASAVDLLLWGAANEPRGSILPAKKSDQVASGAKSANLVHASRNARRAESYACRMKAMGGAGQPKASIMETKYRRSFIVFWSAIKGVLHFAGLTVYIGFQYLHFVIGSSGFM